jgi:hypothetical protein
MCTILSAYSIQRFIKKSGVSQRVGVLFSFGLFKPDYISHSLWTAPIGQEYSLIAFILQTAL